MRFLLAFIAAFSSMMFWPLARADNRPNILIITADDLGLHLGAYGNKIVHTPAIDTLAQQGVTFDRAYVTQSACSPSRASLLSSSHPHENGMMGLVTAGFEIHQGTPLLSGILAKQGYYTGAIGKFHMGDPKALGFVDSRPAKQESPAGFGERLVAQIKRAKEKPFFILAGLLDAHAPYVKDSFDSPKAKINCKSLPKEVMAGWRPNPHQQKNDFVEEVCGYYHEINRMDEFVKATLDALQKLGVRDNTIVIFAGDNGANFYHGKLTLLEGGINVPLIISYPKSSWSTNRRNTDLVSLIDIAPTILDVLEVSAPTSFKGQSLVPILSAQKYRARRDALFAEYTEHNGYLLAPSRAIITDRFKLIHNLVRSEPLEAALRQEKKMYKFQQWAPEYALYDLSMDPREALSLDIKEHADLFASLNSRLRQWQKDTKDPFVDAKGLVDFYLDRLHRAKPQHVTKYHPLREP